MEILKGTPQELNEFLDGGMNRRNRWLDQASDPIKTVLDAYRPVFVRGKRRKLGYKRNSWRRADLLQVQELARQGSSKRMIGKMVSRTTASIANVLYRLKTGYFDNILALNK